MSPKEDPLYDIWSRTAADCLCEIAEKYDITLCIENVTDRDPDIGDISAHQLKQIYSSVPLRRFQKRIRKGIQLPGLNQVTAKRSPEADRMSPEADPADPEADPAGTAVYMEALAAEKAWAVHRLPQRR